MKRVIVSVLALLMVAALTVAPVETNAVVEEYTPYEFLTPLYSIVEYDNQWWEVTAQLEQIHYENGNAYPWYRLSRTVNGKIKHKWILACPFDHGDEESLCCDPWTGDCPDPPGAPC